MPYEKTTWEDSPSTTTPINATNLNHLEDAMESVVNKLDLTTSNPSAQTNYNVDFTQSTNNKRNINNGLIYSTIEGTTSAKGISKVILGNNTGSGTIGNKEGSVRIYSGGTGYTDLQADTSNSNFTITLPSLTGKAVVKQGATITADANGWYVVDMGAYKMYFINSQTTSDTYNASSWGGKQINLPNGISFNSSKMAFMGNARGNDHALRVGTSISNGASAFTLSWHNAHTGSITTTIFYNATLIVFP